MVDPSSNTLVITINVFGQNSQVKRQRFLVGNIKNLVYAAYRVIPKI